MAGNDVCEFTPERLVYWYLRLNGYLTIENFVVHPDRGTNQRTDADLLGVRFAYRMENAHNPMIDDAALIQPGSFVDAVIVEVKRGQCALNGPWTTKAQQNVQRVLRAIGCVPISELEGAAASLYDQGYYASERASIRILAIGDSESNLTQKVPQILFDHVIDFIYKRFSEYQRQKRNINNWASDGRAIRALFDEHHRDATEFSVKIRERFCLPSRRRA